MNLLLDTNIVIPLEPTSVQDSERNSAQATELVRLANKAGAGLFLHPQQKQDFENDRDERRKEVRKTLTSKYQVLKNPPHPTSELIASIGKSEPGSHGFVDDHLLAAVEAPAVDYLVTEDQGIWRKAIRAGLSDRVISLSDAVGILRDLFDQPVAPPPAVLSLQAYGLDKSDPIWTSFRADYSDFDAWFDKCRREHRDSWVIPTDEGYAGVAIINLESNPPDGLNGRVLKLCSFKASDQHSGLRFGELLLKAVFRHAQGNAYEWIFVEVLPKHDRLIQFLSEFGFREMGRTSRGEIRMSKPLMPTDEAVSGLEFNVRFGPRYVDWAEPVFVIPIKPTYDELLFPDQQHQTQLIPGEHPFGNSLRKAYICHSRSKGVQAGSILLFYRSTLNQGLTSVGVVEGILRSTDANEIAAAVAKRTVYSFPQIVQMSSGREVLTILFRQASPIEPVIRLVELRNNGVLRAPPQSIVQLKEDAKKWIVNRLSQ